MSVWTKERVLALSTDEIRIKVCNLLDQPCVLWPFDHGVPEIHVEKEEVDKYGLGPAFELDLARPKSDSPWPPMQCEEGYSGAPKMFWATMEIVPDYPNDIGAAMTDLFESVYSSNGELDPFAPIKDGVWALGTVDDGRNCTRACLTWQARALIQVGPMAVMKFRPLKVEVTCPCGEMARAITLCWVCAMLGVSDER